MDSLLLDFDLNFGGVCLDHLSGHSFVYERSLIDSSEVKRTCIQFAQHQQLGFVYLSQLFPFFIISLHF